MHMSLEKDGWKLLMEKRKGARLAMRGKRWEENTWRGLETLDEKTWRSLEEQPAWRLEQ